jgi:hypothetical protein
MLCFFNYHNHPCLTHSVYVSAQTFGNTCHHHCFHRLVCHILCNLLSSHILYIFFMQFWICNSTPYQLLKLLFPLGAPCVNHFMLTSSLYDFFIHIIFKELCQYHYLFIPSSPSLRDTL